MPTLPDALLHADLLPIPLTNANLGQTHSHHRAHRLRRRIVDALRARGYARQPFAVPTGVVVTRILGPGEQLWDSSSVLRGSWKQLEDSLVELGWWPDDGPRYIRWTLGLQRADCRHLGPATWVAVVDATQVDILSTLPELAGGPLTSAKPKSDSEHPPTLRAR